MPRVHLLSTLSHLLSRLIPIALHIQAFFLYWLYNLVSFKIFHILKVMGLFFQESKNWFAGLPSPALWPSRF